MRTSTDQLMYHHRDEITATIDSTGLNLSDQALDYLEADPAHPGLLSSYCLGPTLSSTTRTIAFKDILWCEPVDPSSETAANLVLVTFISPSANTVSPRQLQIQVNGYEPTTTSSSSTSMTLSESIMKSAYGESTVSPHILIVINPHSGRGEANRIYHQEILPILKGAHVPVTYVETGYTEHAVQIAKDLEIDKFDIIACCSGDGIPHEIINGLYQRKDRVDAFNKVALTQLPCGSGNSMTLSTHGTANAAMATVNMLKAKKSKLDLMAVSQNTLLGEITTKLSFLSQSYGIIADADIGTEYLRWMGPIRFDLGVACRLLIRSTYPCDLYVDYVTTHKSEIDHHFATHKNSTNDSLDIVTEENFTLSAPSLNQNPPSTWKKLDTSHSDNLNVLYVGKMPYISKDVQFFPAALPNDGAMDMVISDTKMSVMEAIKMFDQVGNGHHVFNEKVLHAKIAAYRLVPRLKNSRNHYISVDGESFPFEPLQVEVLPKVLTVLLPEGDYVLTGFTNPP
jgi:sphingosine kinase